MGIVAMLRDEAVTRMRRDLGFNTALSTVVLVDALKDAQVSLEREPELPFFLRTEITSIPTVATEERIELPADFLTIVEDDALWLFDATADKKWKELPKHDLDALRRKFASSDDAEPQAYALDNLYFRMFPTPDAVYTLKMIYMGKAEVLDTNIENAWLKHFPFLLINMGLKRVTKGTRDVAAYNLAQAEETTERARLRTYIIARETTNFTYQMGGAE